MGWKRMWHTKHSVNYDEAVRSRRTETRDPTTRDPHSGYFEEHSCNDVDYSSTLSSSCLVSGGFCRWMMRRRPSTRLGRGARVSVRDAAPRLATLDMGWKRMWHTKHSVNYDEAVRSWQTETGDPTTRDLHSGYFEELCMNWHHECAAILRHDRGEGCACECA